MEAHTVVQASTEQEEQVVEEMVVVQEVQDQLVELQEQLTLVVVAEVEQTLVILEEQVEQVL